MLYSESMPKQKAYCLIPARGGSKRIPRKNIKLFHGKPLIAWSIEVAKSSGLFEEVYVSTDDVEIATISEYYGAVAPFLRPKDLSNDYALDHEVRAHFINWANTKSLEIDILCYLYATAPFITTNTLIECKDLLVTNDVTEVFTVTSYAYPVLRALKTDENGFLTYVWDKFADSRSQELPEYLHDAGQCYFYNLRRKHNIPSRLGLKLPRYQCQDIDTSEDFVYAESLFRASYRSN